MGLELPSSLGGIKELEGLISESLASPVEEVHAAIQKAPFVNADDTGWREANQRAVLWNANTPEMAIFQITPKKDHASAQALLGKKFAGILGVDRAKSGLWRSQLRQALSAFKTSRLGARPGQRAGPQSGGPIRGENRLLWWSWGPSLVGGA